MFLLCLDDWPVWVMSVVSLSKDARARALCSKVCHNNGLMIQILPVIKMYQTRNKYFHSLSNLHIRILYKKIFVIEMP